MNTTQIIAEANRQELFIIREFDSSREEVFEAFSNPEILEQFFAPFNLTMHFNYASYKTGGGYSWSNKRDGKTVCTFSGVVHELAKPIRIVQTAELMDMPERGNVVLEIIRFDELPQGRAKVTIHDICPNVETRDAMIAQGMEKGLKDIFNKLDRLLILRKR
jgi:uncharacterized protein YndB with AHSA1/START domain